ncbi:AAA family ATPase [Candidatus Erwinia haradaeae]|uniref:AAA family ATPase n=1 Tax=Candidatus Erwinia haradaeae TaxID=1922217 RepID=UPI0013002656|nr:Lon protease family protein [Candidatus Erwinia haradaeae]
MKNYKLEWHALQPAIARFQHVSLDNLVTYLDSFSAVQTRLYYGLDLLLKTRAQVPIMIIKSPATALYFTLLQRILSSLTEHTKDKSPILYGGRYEINEEIVHWYPVKTIQDNFSSSGGVYQAAWIEHNHLFGSVRFHQSKISLSPGLVHRANGGVLILSIRTLLEQPLIWFRLKKMLIHKKYEWYSHDEHAPLPLDIPSMPMQLRLLLLGERDMIEALQNLDSEVSSISLYSEFEDKIEIFNDMSLINWRRWVQNVVEGLPCPMLDHTFWPVLIHEGTRWTGDQRSLPLDLDWISTQVQEAILYSDGQIISGENLQQAMNARIWREGCLAENILNDIIKEQVHIDTKGAVIGQINALSIIEYPGHPRAFGEPLRISCVVHSGDGELNDVERKVALGGNIHSKGLMIIQSWLMSVLQLDQPMPFSASLVFEQSYTEVDGDSASLAALCALISALSLQPINQKIAVTGSLDQFGHVQSVGGINEKIEGFFHICNKRTLTGNQGVIIPSTNIRHLALHKDVIHAVRNEKFYIWAVSSVDEAIFLLTGVAWKDAESHSLLRLIQTRIAKFTMQDTRHRVGPMRWLSCLK